MKTAFPNLRQPVKLALFSNVPFDNTYKNHSMISSLFKYNGNNVYTGMALFPVQERFLNRVDVNNQRLYPEYNLEGDFNFNYTNGLVTSVTLELTPEQTNANYMRVLVTDGQHLDNREFYYYFITGISQVNYNTYTLSLELDVLMTYQDEFLEGMKDVPVFTTRKHCHRYTNDGIVPHCADLKAGDSTFANIKPANIKTRISVELPEQYELLSDVKWLYVCVEPKYISEYELYNNYCLYKFKGVRQPLSMICLPINVESLTINYIYSQNPYVTDSIVFSKEKIDNLLNSLVGNGKVHGCKISNYPPFMLSEDAVVTKVGNAITIDDDIHLTQIDLGGTASDVLEWRNAKTNLYIDNVGSGSGGTGKRFLVIVDDKGTPFTNEDITLPVKNSVSPTIVMPRYDDPKLLFSPFRKYELASVYSSGYEIYPELIYSDGVYYGDFKFKTHYNYFIGDYTIFTYLEFINDANNVSFFQNYPENNIGLSASMNYIIPTGTNALDVFNTTQANSFYQSKNASGISSVITIAGGIASTIIGAVAEMPTAGASTAMIAGGLTAVAGGVASGVNAIKSASAKIEDLKNTPDSVNVAGSSFVSDLSRARLTPFVNIYEVNSVIKENANDFFYEYGYETARDCYFNTELSYNNDTSNSTDNNLFGRTIFNYIKINEDITNKINANIPLVVKKKLSAIFNEGITIWNFFGFNSLWGMVGIVTQTNDPSRWFMKHTLDNTEYKGGTI